MNYDNSRPTHYDYPPEYQENYRNEPREWERRRDADQRMRNRSRSRDRYDDGGGWGRGEHRDRDRDHRDRDHRERDERRRSPEVNHFRRRSPERRRRSPDRRRDREWEHENYGGLHNSNYDERRDREHREYRRSPKGNADREYKPLSPTLMIKGILPDTNEEGVQRTLKAYSPQSIRIIRNKTNPTGKGYCFVDFTSEDHAKMVLQTIRASEDRGYPLEIDGSVCTLEFAESSKARAYHGSNSKRDSDRYGMDMQQDVENLPSGMAAYSAQSNSMSHRMDWICIQCSAQNFARRSLCFRCQSPRTADCQLLDPLAPLDSSGTSETHKPLQMPADNTPPSDTLILRGLSTSSAETSVQQALRIFASTIQDVRLIRNRDHSSRGFCFVEFTSIEAATHALTMCLREGLIVDGHQVTIAFASQASHFQKHRSQSGSGSEHAQLPHSQGHTKASDEQDQTHDPDGSYDPSFDEPGFNNATLEDQKKKRKEAQAESLAAAAAVLKKKKSPYPPTFEEAGAAYVFDASSGYFYEASSGWYYEPKTKLYYGIPATGGTEQKWHIHNKDQDPPFQVYDPQTAQAQASTASTSQPQPQEAATSAQADAPDQGQKAKSDVDAHQVQQSAEAQTAKPQPTDQGQVQGHQSIKINVTQQLPAPTVTPPTPSQPPPKKKKKKIDLATWEAKKKKQEEAMKAPVIMLKMTHTIKPMAPKEEPKPPASDPQPSSSSGNADAKSAAAPKEKSDPPTPKTKKIATACLLCKRGFPTTEKLKLHEEKSKLHKENLAKAKAEGKSIPKTVQQQEDEQKKKKTEVVSEPAPDREGNRHQSQNSTFMIADAPASSFSLGSKSSQEAPSLVAEVLSMEVAPQYRDRASLRRQGNANMKPQPVQVEPQASDVYIPPPTAEEAAMFLQPESKYQATSAVPIHHQQSNVGAAMLNRMGWRDGQGLGKDGAGMVNPVQADNSFERKQGIGTQQAKGLNYTVNPEDSYKDTIHKMSQARFEAADSNLNWNKRL